MILDLILIALLVCFVIGGYKKGLIKSLGSLLGFILTILLVSWFYPWLMTKADTFWGKVIVFVIALIIISALISLAIWIVEKIFKIFSFIPGSKILNKFLGAGIGLISGLLMTSFLVWMIIKLSVISPWLINQIDSSYLVGPMLAIAYIWIPIVPKVYREVKNNL